MEAEQIIIVDKNDKIIGYKNREDLKRSDIYRVSALWLTNSKGKILLAQRALSKKHDPGLWGTAVAGTVEKGETYQDNMAKEAEEEIGLKDFDFTQSKKVFITRKFNYFSQRYLAIVNKDIEEFKIDKKEVKAIKWFSKNELLNELKKNPQNFLSTVEECVKWFSK